MGAYLNEIRKDLYETFKKENLTKEQFLKSWKIQKIAQKLYEEIDVASYGISFEDFLKDEYYSIITDKNYVV
ncbi:MAG: hypothetical protein J6T10_24105 [Methanobrevibacter sp.]|nr:hypothetical protein [Methanobrevibacter sp.]